MNKIAKQHMTFERIRHADEHGNEYWYARQLGAILEYSQWRNFLLVVEKAKEACENSGQKVEYHFADVSRMIKIGKGGQREVDDYKLSRYACYLIVQNGDPSKPVIALGQTYFALQTRRQELQAGFQELPEDERRLAIRREMVGHNKALVAAAKKAGVETNLDYAIFQDHGYRGLYGGLGAHDIHARKGLKKSHKILDHMGSTELAANLFRATQTEEKLKRERVRGKQEANQTHREVGAKVRQTIKELGGTMPEDLPTPEKSIQQLERERKKLTEK
ncbi:MAG: DNA damage-inducible protein D [Desulfovibrio sp.]|jgi:DNA-damage-inducible protein D|nr:DNA damage-inducible protein D [Desulfovibrio sp.]